MRACIKEWGRRRLVRQSLERDGGESESVGSADKGRDPVLRGVTQDRVLQRKHGSERTK